MRQNSLSLRAGDEAAQWGARAADATCWRNHPVGIIFTVCVLETRPLDDNLIEIAILAAVAGFVLFRLYATLGRRTGAEPPPRPQPAQGELPPQRTFDRGPFGSAAVQSGDGLAAIVRADPSFNPDQFLTGARGAYEVIVGAFAKGDRDALKTLLTPRVYDSYVKAITAREEKGEQGPELVRLRNAEAIEMVDWVRTARGEGAATKVIIR